MSADVGQWVSIGPTLIPEGLGATGRVTTIAIDPSQPDTIYAGGLSGNPAQTGGSGLWKTTDGGSAWFPITDTLPSLKVGAVALEPGRPTTVYAAIWNRKEDNGALYRSDDGGGSWLLVGESAALLCRAVLIDPATPSRMFTATVAGVHWSIDGGATWLKVLARRDKSRRRGIGSRRTVSSSCWGLAQDERLGVGGLRDPRQREFVEEARWVSRWPASDEHSREDIRIAMASDRVYASFRTSAELLLYRTIDPACLVDEQPEQTWERCWVAGSDIAPSLWSYLYVHPSAPDIVYATGTSFRRSTDGGSSFSVMNGPHADHHAFAADPADRNVVYTGCDGGIYRSNDRGAAGSWSFVGKGMTNTEFYDLAQAATNTKLVVGGTQDNGTLRSRPESTYGLDPGRRRSHCRHRPD